MGQEQQGGAPPAGGGAPQAQGGQSVNVIELADAYSRKIANMPPEESGPVLQQMKMQMPELHDLVQQKLSVQKALSQKPLPEQKPPRRANAVI